MVARYKPSSGAGRPSGYRPEYCAKIIESGKRGMTLSAFAGSVGSCRETLLNWSKKFPEFALARQHAEAAAAYYWEEKLCTLANTGRGSAAAIIFALKNRVPDEWREQLTQKYEGSKEQPIVLTLDPQVLQRISTDQQETLRTVLKAIASGGPAIDAAMHPAKPATPSRFAETLRLDSPTDGRA